VSINNGTCESSKTRVVATLTTSGCVGNEPPVIAPTVETTTIGGEVTLDLTAIISDPNDNVDLSTLAIISQPQSGAVAFINPAHQLTVNYQGISFSGTDRLTIQVCDLAGACTQQEITIDVGGSVIVYNAVSPNGDGKNDIFVLEYIDVLPNTQDNTVSIFNRWGDEVFSITNYNNTTRAFSGISSDGKQLPPGTYFYKVTFTSGAKTLKGYLQINR
jgi:gliding motility-associated-like protein